MVRFVIEMQMVGVRVELPSNSPIVLLQEQGGDERLLPIFIGGAEATAIALALDEVEPPRPMTHDLMRSILTELDVTLERVVITDLQDRTFFAELRLVGNGTKHTISSRPSDAMALAVRTSTPVFVEESVIDQAGYTANDDDGDEDDNQDPDEVLEQFREFIDTVTPDDFDG